ncbi:MAG TPA: transporter substrate-binding domain-containing protein, partial [Burkholderiaceae bacterium]|nr:transporter substrate-binding domain-containing protein [Burkholderiaceae bacterium]
LFLAGLLLCQAVVANANGEVVFATVDSNAMPLAGYEDGQLRNGILKDVGNAIARQLGRTARFVTLPRNRVGTALVEGQVDGNCYLLPAWMEPAAVSWSRPLIPNQDLVVGRTDAAALRSAADLADEPIGTVLGYRYPELENGLGSRFRRDDAPDMISNLRKLAAGRVRYAIVDRLTLQYETRTTLRDFKPGPSLTLASFVASCVFSPKGKVPTAELQRSVDALLLDRTIDTILARYR